MTSNKDTAITYKFIEHTGDLGLRVYGNTKEEIFINGAKAFAVCLFGPTPSVNCTKSVSVTFSANSLDELLVSWLGELLYMFETEAFVPGKFDILYLDDQNLKAVVWGEAFDSNRHEIHNSVKAVTFHKLYVKYKGGVWQAQVIMDI